jgi:hypothetical protein
MKRSRRLANKEEILPLLLEENESEFLKNLWPRVHAGISDGGQEERYYPHSKWKWALVAAGMMIILLSGIWFFNFFDMNKASVDREFIDPFRINYVSIDNKPARAYVFKGPDSNMTFVWVEEKDKGEEL